MSRSPAELLLALAAAEWDELGRSQLGRAIVGRRFAGGAAPTAVFFGAIHGDEPLGACCLLRLADELAARAEPLARTVWLVPVVNPDGLIAGTKDNARGVDLNRNWPARNFTREHPPGYAPGEHPLSEPETRTLAGLIHAAHATRLIALHSPFRTVNWDGAGAALAERMARANGYGATDDIGYATPGSFGSYHGKDLGREVITLEIPPLSPEAAWQENRAALLVAVDGP
ncbi:MAG: DUF2817 domain-containing protein [Myxococcales bacterium]|nr:DUF2817 domain-containing protein [Myxococcales bacterium]